MTTTIFWFSLSAILISIELFTGSFYLLMIALGTIAGGIVAYLGFDLTFQWVITSIISILGVVLWHKYRILKGFNNNKNTNILFDKNEIVNVLSWENDRAKVNYRGAVWDAIIDEKEKELIVGNHYIKNIVGNTLVLSKNKS